MIRAILFSAAFVALVAAETRYLVIDSEKPSATYAHGDGSQSTVTLNCRATDFLVTLNRSPKAAFASITASEGGNQCEVSARSFDSDGPAVIDWFNYEDEMFSGPITRESREPTNTILTLTGQKDVCLNRVDRKEKALSPAGCSTHHGRVLIVEHLSTKEPTIHLVSHTYVDIDCCVRPSAASGPVETTPASAEVEACKNATFNISQIPACEENHVAWGIMADNGQWTTSQQIGWMVESCTAVSGTQSSVVFDYAKSDIQNDVSKNENYPEIEVHFLEGTQNYMYTFDVHYFLPTDADELKINCAVRFCKRSGTSNLEQCPTYTPRPECKRRPGDFTLTDFTGKKVNFAAGQVSVNRNLE